MLQGKWFDLFIDKLDGKVLTHIKRYSSERKLKFGEKWVLNSSFYAEMLILLAGENVLIKFDL